MSEALIDRSERLPMIVYLSAVRDHELHAWDALLAAGYHPSWRA